MIRRGLLACIAAASVAGCGLDPSGTGPVPGSWSYDAGDPDVAAGGEAGPDVSMPEASVESAAPESGPDAEDVAPGPCSPPCTDQTCVNGACVGVCAQGQTRTVPCGNCGTEADTCDPSGQWTGTCANQGACAPASTGTCNTYGTKSCSPACAWGPCTCPSAAACMPGTKGCVANGPATCDACGQWTASGPSCGSQVCSGGQCQPCSVLTCGGGCCDAKGCEPGSSNTTCGIAGGACTDCTKTNKICAGNICL